MLNNFTVNGNVFLAFANYHGDIYKHKAVSMIYKMNEHTGKFNLHQTLQTRGAYGLEYFSIALVCQCNGQRFVVFQKIPKPLHIF